MSKIKTEHVVKKFPTWVAEYDRAADVCCGGYHSGSHDLVEFMRGSWQCSGCHNMFSSAELIDAAPADTTTAARVIRRWPSDA